MQQRFGLITFGGEMEFPFFFASYKNRDMFKGQEKIFASVRHSNNNNYGRIVQT